MRTPLPLLAALLALAGTAPAGAQVPQAGARTLALGVPPLAGARGFTALQVNPAGLGAPGSPPWTLAILPVRLGQGLEPVGLGDVGHYGGKDLPPSVREAWLQRVEDAGVQSGAGSGQVSLASFSRGHLAVQVGTLALATARLNADATELLLFGNTGRTGSPGDFRLGGSHVEAAVVTNVALAGGWPVGTWKGGTLSLGATASVTLGNALLAARDNGSSLTGDPLEFDLHFPILEAAPDAGLFDLGRGLGLDVGALWTGDRLGVGVTLHNVVNTFAWNVDRLTFRPGSALFDAQGSSSDFERQPADEAPPLLLDALPEMEFGPVAGVGASWALRPNLSLLGSVQGRLGEGFGPEPSFLAGAAVEYEPDPRLRFQGGLAGLTGAVQASGGLTVILDSVHLAGALALRRGDGRNASLGALTVSLLGG